MQSFQLPPRTVEGVVLESFSWTILATAGLLGNILVCAAFFRNPVLRRLTTVYIIALAIIDILNFSTCGVFVGVTLITGSWQFGDAGCYFSVWFVRFLVYVTVITMSLTAINRCIKATKPEVFQNIFAPKPSIVILVCLWIVVAMVFSPPFISGGSKFVFHPGYALCVPLLEDELKVYDMITHVSFMTASLVIIAVCYYKVYRAFKQVQQQDFQAKQKPQEAEDLQHPQPAHRPNNPQATHQPGQQQLANQQQEPKGTQQPQLQEPQDTRKLQQQLALQHHQGIQEVHQPKEAAHQPEEIHVIHQRQERRTAQERKEAQPHLLPDESRDIEHQELQVPQHPQEVQAAHQSRELQVTHQPGESKAVKYRQKGARYFKAKRNLRVVQPRPTQATQQRKGPSCHYRVQLQQPQVALRPQEPQITYQPIEATDYFKVYRVLKNVPPQLEQAFRQPTEPQTANQARQLQEPQIPQPTKEPQASYQTQESQCELTSGPRDTYLPQEPQAKQPLQVLQSDHQTQGPQDPYQPQATQQRESQTIHQAQPSDDAHQHQEAQKAHRLPGTHVTSQRRKPANSKTAKAVMRAKEAKITKMMFGIVLAFVLLWFPLFVFFAVTCTSQVTMQREVTMLITYGFNIRSLINPVLYAVMNRACRNEFRDILWDIVFFFSEC